VLDAWSRRVVGWAMATHLRTELVLAALDMAVAQRRPTEVIHHSDQGCQYTSPAFGGRCREAGVRRRWVVSVTPTTTPCVRASSRTQAAARLALFDSIESWYNRRRRHSALDYLSPIAFETAHGLGDRAGASESTDRRHGHCGIPRGMPKKSRMITIDKVVRPRTGGRPRC